MTKKINQSIGPGVCALLLLASVAPLQPADAFPDVSSGQWFSNFVSYLNERNIVTGYPDSTFKPHKNVTRAEFAAMLAKAQGVTTGGNTATQFQDVPASHWASGAISLAASRGWITGYPDGSFGPEKPITHSEMYTIVSKLINESPPSNVSEILSNLSDGSSVPSWAQQPIAMVVEKGVYVSEVTPSQITPFATASRADVSGTLAKLINSSFRTPITIAQTPEPVTPDPVTPETVTDIGTLRRTNDGWLMETLSGIYSVASGALSAYQFNDGQQVNFTGSLLPGQGSLGRRILQLANIDPVSSPGARNVTITGFLKPAARGSGWAVNDRSGQQRYVLYDVGNFEKRPWFQPGTRVEVEGTIRPSAVKLPGQLEPLFVSRMRSIGGARDSQVNVVGRLDRTVEPGGWTVTNPQTREKYLLMQADRYEANRWFREGRRVRVQGTARPNMPTTYMEGTPLVVTNMQAI